MPLVSYNIPVESRAPFIRIPSDHGHICKYFKLPTYSKHELAENGIFCTLFDRYEFDSLGRLNLRNHEVRNPQFFSHVFWHLKHVCWRVTIIYLNPIVLPKLWHQSIQSQCKFVIINCTEGSYVKMALVGFWPRVFDSVRGTQPWLHGYHWIPQRDIALPTGQHHLPRVWD